MNISSIRSNPWPYAIAAWFALAITAITAFIVFVQRHPEELVRSDYYEQEIRFQRDIDSRNRATRHPATIELAQNTAGGEIVVTLPVEHLRQSPAGLIRLYRPSDSAQDREVRLATGPDGVQRLDVRTLPSGLWKVRVQWTVDGVEYVADRPVVIGAPRA